MHACFPMSYTIYTSSKIELSNAACRNLDYVSIVPSVVRGLNLIMSRNETILLIAYTLTLMHARYVVLVQINSHNATSYLYKYVVDS